MKEPKKPEKPNTLLIGLIAVGVVCAFAIGFIAGGLLKSGKAGGGAAGGLVQVALQDGTTLGARLSALEKSLKDYLGQNDKALMDQTKEELNSARLYDLNWIPIQFLDLGNAGRFAVNGPPDATVTLVEFSDFQCPYCSRMAKMLDELVKKYPGRIRLIFVDRPLTSKYRDGYPYHPYAFTAHEAAAEALTQGKFWEMYRYIYENQDKLFPEARPQSPPDYDQKLQKLRDDLAAAAGTLGMDPAKMKTALETHTHQAELEKSLALAEKLKVYSTPTVYVDGYFQFSSPDTFMKLMDNSAKIE